MSKEVDNRITIALTDERPVTIVVDEWDVIATADDQHITNEECETPYDPQGASCISEIETQWELCVRRNKQDRTVIVSAIYYRNAINRNHVPLNRCYEQKAGIWLSDQVNLAENEVLDHDIIDTIKNVGKTIATREHYEDDAARWLTLVDECIRSLEPVDFWH